MNKYAEKQEMPTLQELADALCEDNEIQYVTLESKVGNIEKITVGDKTSIYTKLIKYPYEFEINSKLQLASIDGVKIANIENVSENIYTLFGIQATEGKGTNEAPYIIKTADQLLALSNLVNAGRSFEKVWFALDNDITLDYNKNWEPIGNSETTCFKGNFDGRNHQIKGLYFNDTTRQYIGLFGHAQGSTIKNLRISSENSSINANAIAGGVIGEIRNGIIENCVNETNITINGTDSVGGIAGVLTGGIIRNCSNSGNITGKTCGGIVGYTTAMNNENCEILNCINTGTISGTNNAGITSRVFNPSGKVTIKGCTTTTLNIYATVVTPSDLTVED